MADTNAFNPAGFYGVAFEHLPDGLALAVTEPTDVAAINTALIATLSLAAIEATDVLDAALVVAVNTLDLAATESADVLAANISVISEMTLEVVEAADVLSATIDVVAEMVLAATEDFQDTFSGVVGRWDFIYVYGEGIRVPWEDQVASVPAEPEPVEEPVYVPWERSSVVVSGRPETIVVPAAEVVARLREDRKSYIGPRKW
jgi:hypothetical protein